MNATAKRAVTSRRPCALLATPDSELAAKLASEAEHWGRLHAVSAVSGLAQLRERLRHITPRVIFLDDAFLDEAPVIETLRQLTETAPVVLLTAHEQQTQASQLVAEGDVELVARVGDFIAVAAALIERRLRWAERSEASLGAPWAELPEDIAEIFRHEINNPLTGILGNAELLLAHRDRLPAVDTHRLQTVVDLAVRLRETVRRLSNAWEVQAHALKSS